MKAITLILALAAPSSHAITGNQLNDLMTTDKDLTSKLAAMMYVTGITDGIALNQYLASARNVTLGERAVCLPSGGQVAQAYDVIKTFLAENPANRHLDAGALSAVALNRAWPCR